MATRRGDGRPPQQTPAKGAALNSLAGHVPAQAASAHALNARLGAHLATEAPAGTQATGSPAPAKPPRAQQLQPPAPGAAQAVAAGNTQARGSVEGTHTQPSTSPASKGEPLPEIQRAKVVSPTGTKGEPQPLPKIPRETVPTQKANKVNISVYCPICYD